MMDSCAVPALLDDPRYYAFLAQAHPELCIDTCSLALPTFVAPLDTWQPIEPGVLRRLTALAGRAMPRQVAPPCLYLGTPFERYDQTSLLDRVADVAGLAGGASELARRERLDVVVVTNVSLDHPRFSQWVHEGFKVLPSFPDTLIDLSPPSFDDHLARLPAADRSGIRRNIRRFERAGHTLERLSSSAVEARALFDAYRPLYQRATVPWLAHTEQYFGGLAGLDDRVHLTVARTHRGAVAGFIVSFEDDNGFQCGRVGIRPDYHHTDAVYFRLLYHVVEESIAGSQGLLSLEPTGYRMKRHLGASLRPLVNLCLGVSSTWRALLAAFAGLGRRLLNHLEQPRLLEQTY